MYPYILNINEDAQLSGMVKLFIQEGPYVCLSVSIEKNKHLNVFSSTDLEKLSFSIHNGKKKKSISKISSSWLFLQDHQ